MDKLPTELIIKIVNSCNTVCDQIAFIGAITHNDQLLEKYNHKHLVPQEIKLIESYITFYYIPYSEQYFDYYWGLCYDACIHRIIGLDLLDYKPNYTNLHSTSSNRNRGNIHNFFKTTLKKLLPFETDKLFILMIKILDYVTSEKVDQVCLNMEWLLCMFYQDLEDKLNRYTFKKKERTKISLLYFFILYYGEKENSSCETCKQFL